MISSGCAAWPEFDTTYLAFGCEEGSSDALEMPNGEGGMLEGIVL